MNVTIEVQENSIKFQGHGDSWLDDIADLLDKAVSAGLIKEPENHTGNNDTQTIWIDIPLIDEDSADQLQRKLEEL